MTDWKSFFLVKSHRGEKRERKVICLSCNIDIQQKKPNSEPQNSHLFKNGNMIKKMLGKTARAGRIFFPPTYLWFITIYDVSLDLFAIIHPCYSFKQKS